MAERRQVSDSGTATLEIRVTADVEGFGLVPVVMKMEGPATLDLDQPAGLNLENAPPEMPITLVGITIHMDFPDGTSYDVEVKDGATGKVVRKK
jgi:hypothetical protein